MTDIYGYATAAPLYRAAGWMQVIPLPEGRKTPPPSGFTGRSRKPVTDEQIQLWSQANPNANTGIVIPEGVLVLDIDAAQGHQSRRTGRKASANSLRNWACFRPRGAARRTASTRRHATCSTRCPKASRGRAAPSRASTSCNPATGIPWSGRRSTRVAKCTAGTRPAAGLPARSPASATWRHCHGSGWTTCANPTECRIRPL